ncbi:hypothetical protein BJ170DRAFT_687069 [Xylariales sp. AK1849]|nr:hypothetical protein BJ170DRAFT_687069 [Xylariales sp. AK1849]
MPTYKVEGCTVKDGTGLARNNMSAWWDDPTWVLLWENKTLDFVIAQCTKRMPKNLLNDRAHKRHQKVIDAESGQIMGYARWTLPERLTGGWLEAQTPAVSTAEEKKILESFASADWHIRPGMDSLDDPTHVTKDRLRKGKEYMELEFLAVHPDYKGHGVASMLVQSGVTQSEKMEVDIFMLAMKAGLGVYKRLGFDMLEYLIQDDSQFGGKGEYGTYFLERKSKRES